MVDEQLELRRELRQVNKQLRLELREERRRCDDREKWLRRVVWVLLTLVAALTAKLAGLPS